MKICIVASSGISLTNFRGPLIKSWKEMGHEVVAISIERIEEVPYIKEELGIEYVQVAGSRTGIGIFEGIKMIIEYKSAFDKIKPDMCFLYMSKPVAFGGRAAVMSGVKHINALVNGLANSYYRSSIKDWLVRKVMYYTYHYTYSHCDNVFMQNTDDYNMYMNNGYSKMEVTHIVNGSGVDMTYFSRKELPSEPIFLMISRLLWSKGIREYLDAIKIVKSKISNAHFMLVGGLDCNDEAIDEKELALFVKDYDIEYFGHADDVRPYLEKCSVFVLPSYHEGTPRCVLEAMAVGRPIITTLAPGCRDTVIDGTNGFLVPIKDSETLADAMIKLAINPDLRNVMANASYEICKKKYEVSLVNKSMNERMFKCK